MTKTKTKTKTGKLHAPFLRLLGVCVFRRQYPAFLQISFLPNENLIRPLKGAMGVKMKDQSLHAFPLYLIPKA